MCECVTAYRLWGNTLPFSSQILMWTARVAALALALSAAAPAAATSVGDYVKLWACARGPAQSFDMGNASFPRLAGEIIVRGTETASPVLVWSIEAAPKIGANLHIWGTGYGANGEEAWAFEPATGLIRSGNWTSWCARAPAIGGLPLAVAACDAHDARQVFTYDAPSGALALVADAAQCVDAGTPLPNCTVPPLSAATFCDQTAGARARAADLVARLSNFELASLVSFSNDGVPRFGLRAVKYNEALHGAVCGCGAPYFNATTGFNSSGCPTSFPHALLLGATFNRTLWRAIATGISDEGRALHNLQNFALMTWAPDINPFRDPRWGRGQEVAGECPFLLGEYITQYARGMQEGPDTRYTKLLSTAKHWSLYDLERWGAVNRQNFTAIASLRDVVDFYWRPFEVAASAGHSLAIMCSYNAETVSGTGVAGVPSCANGAFTNGVLRDTWGWDGVVVSDCGAVANTFATHHYVDSPAAAVAATMNAGTDVECSFGEQLYTELLPGLVANGTVALATLETAVTRLMTAYFALGLADPNATAYDAWGAERIDTAEHRALALDAAVQGAILLKNDALAATGAPLLPLDAAALRTIAVLGPHANATKAMLSIYAGSNTVVYAHAPLAAIAGRAPAARILFAPGCADVACNATDGFPAAVAAATGADVALLFLGLDATQEDEGLDRVNITLPGEQLAFAQAVVATGTPVVVVLIHGGVLAIEWLAAHVPAILSAHYPGEMGGDALATLLFGDASPSGRATTTWYPAAFVSRAMTDMSLTSGDGLTYLYYTGPVLWPFGWGLSYTTFTFAWLDSGAPLVLETRALAAGLPAPPVGVNVTNAGARTADVSALAFFESGAPGQPLQELFDFARAAALAPGETRTLWFTLPPSVLAEVRDDGTRVFAPARARLRVGGVPRVAGGAPAHVGDFVERDLAIVGDEVLWRASPLAAAVTADRGILQVS